jgi:hypothetical protein
MDNKHCSYCLLLWPATPPPPPPPMMMREARNYCSVPRVRPDDVSGIPQLSITHVRSRRAHDFDGSSSSSLSPTPSSSAWPWIASAPRNNHPNHRECDFSGLKIRQRIFLKPGARASGPAGPRFHQDQLEIVADARRSISDITSLHLHH